MVNLEITNNLGYLINRCHGDPDTAESLTNIEIDFCQIIRKQTQFVVENPVSL